MRDLQQIKKLITEKLNLAEIMLKYNVKFTYDPTLASEVQYRCPFHGEDNKPSARLYNHTQTCFCWVCHKSWDVVSFIMEAENLNFNSAINYITKKYHIDISVIPEEPDIKMSKPQISDNSVKLINLKNRIKNLRGIDLKRYQSAVVAWYMISYSISKKIDASESLNKLSDKIRKMEMSCH